MKRVFFIRHGETTGDVEDRYGGAYDDFLSAAGEQQVLDLSQELKDSGIQEIFCSPLKRARQTARGVADLLKCKVTIIDNLRERAQYGPMTGMKKSEAMQTYPEFVEMVKDRNNTLPGAESYADASKRMTGAFHDVLAKTDSCAAVVWHGGGMRVLFRDILKIGEIKSIGDCCWTEVEFADDSNGFNVRESQRLS